MNKIKNMNKVLFRVDGNSNIGMGHLIRCISLALMLRDDFEITFFCIEVPESVEKEIVNSGFKCFKIIDDNLFLDFINETHIIVLDHYGLGTDYQRKIKKLGCKLVCIDDLHDKEFFADLIINHTIGIKEEDYIAQSYTQFALGLDNVLLRPAFLEQAKILREIKTINNVFICFGGADIKNFTQKVLKIVREFKNFKKIIVVTGVSYPYNLKLNKFISNHSNIERYNNIGQLEMLNLMTQSDLLIVPASGILLEAFSTGAPVISGMCVDNQKYAFKEFKRQNLIISAEKFSVKEIKNALNNAINIPFRQKKGIDGEQKKRLINRFIRLIANLRSATNYDCNLFYEWVNDSQVRSSSINTAKIQLDNHVNWFNSILTTKDSKLFVLQLLEKPVGQIRFEKIDDHWVIDFSIDKSYRGRGLGQIVIKMGLSKFTVPANFVAQVKENNIPSINVFKKLGFIQVKHTGSIITFNKSI